MKLFTRGLRGRAGKQRDTGQDKKAGRRKKKGIRLQISLFTIRLFEVTRVRWTNFCPRNKICIKAWLVREPAKNSTPTWLR